MEAAALLGRGPVLACRNSNDLVSMDGFNGVGTKLFKLRAQAFRDAKKGISYKKVACRAGVAAPTCIRTQNFAISPHFLCGAQEMSRPYKLSGLFSGRPSVFRIIGFGAVPDARASAGNRRSSNARPRSRGLPSGISGSVRFSILQIQVVLHAKNTTSEFQILVAFDKGRG